MMRRKAYSSLSKPITRKSGTMKTKKIFGISLSLILINMASIMERADENLLPAVYKEVSDAFNAGPTELGYLTFIRNFVQALASPIAGILVLHYDRPTILSMGTLFWALSTAAVGVSQEFRQVAFWRAINGVGLAIVIPALQSFIADSYLDGVRGRGFGLLNLVGSIGGIGGGVVATVMAGHDYWGITGWRCAFIMMALLSLLIGFLVFLFVVDPRNLASGHVENAERMDFIEKSIPVSPSTWEDSWMAMKSVMKVHTFRIVVLQGIVGSLPWTAMVFFTMWFELIGFNHKSSAALLSLFAVGCALGNLLGGVIADRISHLYPDSVTLLLMGLTISWCATCANNPIFAEVVPPKHRTMIYAFDRAFEGSFSAFAAPAVGMLSEKLYGYNPKSVKLGSGSVQEAFALSRGLFAMMAVPFGLCCLFYTPLHLTFKRDRECVKLATLKEQDLELT
ncbi:uncharacterized protein LOC18445914 isoform X2 [Amborella trichopoda]|uniref:uncharacterized protein LOC18445914 isoform X2 n=1 Tax=Amborella trichopoda TaxID=13333 RepID=UPI0009C14B8B|nr:uncharacterized protein LOC18445914 isoform X2 [Amborella trichopoda]|eukprot:XP_020530174.1 uncharacterized protein LOC18445914 isoform X2 [Amborella trichopoda]